MFSDQTLALIAIFGAAGMTWAAMRRLFYGEDDLPNSIILYSGYAILLTAVVTSFLDK